MTCHDTHLEVICNHDHCHFINSELLLEILCVASVAESLAYHCAFVDRSSNEHVDMSFLDVGYSSFKGCHCRFCRLWCRLSRLYEHVFRKTVDDVDSFLMNILCRCNDVCVDLLNIVYMLFVEAEDF